MKLCITFRGHSTLTGNSLWMRLNRSLNITPPALLMMSLREKWLITDNREMIELDLTVVPSFDNNVNIIEEDPEGSPEYNPTPYPDEARKPNHVDNQEARLNESDGENF
ncbi:Uncharacterized protein Adt_45769 [Abeliophyllum distichum]|uniref:Uncharacterized protein n=1 Tax=Abeliophyllum distichum TaxID=126358 RepID=A0ABD1PEL5_9LAMI